MCLPSSSSCWEPAKCMWPTLIPFSLALDRQFCAASARPVSFLILLLVNGASGDAVATLFKLALLSPELFGVVSVDEPLDVVDTNDRRLSGV